MAFWLVVNVCVSKFNRRGLEVARRECGFLDELSGSGHVIKKVEEIPNSGERLAVTVVYEALAATSLRRFLDANPEQSLELRVVKSITYQILKGLADAHGLGIFHRDIRPSKIVIAVADNGLLTVKIVDFRDARRVGRPEPVTPTRDIEKVNLYYQSPEQLMGSTSYGAAVDMWVVGCILAELADRCRVLFPGMNLIDSNRTLIQPREQDTGTQYLGQLYKIFSIRGTPRLHLLPANVAGFLDWETVPRFRRANLLRRFPMLGVSGNRLLARLLSYSSVERLSAAAAIEHNFFD
ncbi:cyclin-dependent kinase B1-1-like [Rosa chinensis]|uniref:cyclin-dependent kinase B1-1-like n=1 Tax=Rosa chinensis TaxID=74649 RepID=UPI001AD8ABE9|nr:cyclin-dependent kinase B1-1-like [Rosa chinensis]